MQDILCKAFSGCRLGYFNEKVDMKIDLNYCQTPATRVTGSLDEAETINNNIKTNRMWTNNKPIVDNSKSRKRDKAQTNFGPNAKPTTEYSIDPEICNMLQSMVYT